MLSRIFNTINQPFVLLEMKAERTAQLALKDKINNLKLLCKVYDEGNLAIAKEISVIWRVLFLDTNKDSSLLTQCGLKDKIQMLDSSSPRVGISYFNIGSGISNLNLSFPSNIYCGLVCEDINREGNSICYSFSPLCSSSQYKNSEKYISLKKWSNQIVFDIRGEGVDISLSRADFLQILCNKDGGAHFDKTFTTRGRFDHKSIASYIAFRDDQALHLMVNGVDVRFVNDPAYSSVRQIAHEVLASLEEYM